MTQFQYQDIEMPLKIWGIGIPLPWIMFTKKLLLLLLDSIIPTADIYGPKNLQMVLE